jgi:hypothetical protein
MSDLEIKTASLANTCIITAVELANMAREAPFTVILDLWAMARSCEQIELNCW